MVICILLFFASFQNSINQFMSLVGVLQFYQSLINLNLVIKISKLIKCVPYKIKHHPVISCRGIYEWPLGIILSFCCLALGKWSVQFTWITYIFFIFKCASDQSKMWRFILGVHVYNLLLEIIYKLSYLNYLKIINSK